ncbi:MAG: sugar phosphate isomerase/epimerase [Planctomycetes bacterium]|nr:sugar phosphate isomerase/epimerase [Planctomycetota bacterium]
MNTTRREFLTVTAGLGALSALGCSGLGSAARSPFEISLAEWSLHRALYGNQMTNLDFPSVARRDYDIGVVEYVNSFFKDKARDERYLGELLARCRDAGVANRLIMIDGEGELAHADDAERRKAVLNHQRWVDCAALLGCMAIRVNAAGSGDPGEMQRRAADSLVQLANYGNDKKIAVIVENHGGWSSNGEWLAGVMKLAADPRVGTLPDFGNFNLGGGKTYDRYQGIAEMMPFAKAVSAKSHEFDERGEEVHTDYHRMLRIVTQAGYHEHVGIEYEGEKHSEFEGIRLTKALLEKVRAELA